MFRHARIWAVAALSAFLAACAGGQAVTGPYPVGSYTVTLTKTWVKWTDFDVNREVRLLTMDGPLLNTFHLTEGLAPGRSILRTARKSRPMPVVRAAMSESEMAEFVVDTISAMGHEQVASRNLRPARFGDADAVAFDLSLVTDDGLNVAGMAQVAEFNGMLHVMLFLAPQEHYFGVLKPEVESVFASVRLNR